MKDKTKTAVKSVHTIIKHIIDSEGRCNTPKEFTYQQSEALAIIEYYLHLVLEGNDGKV